MRTLALFAFAALAFGIFVGVIEVVWARRARVQLLEKSETRLHPLTRHRLRRLRTPVSWRVLHHVKLCLAFLLATYVGMLLLKTVHSFVARLLYPR